MIIILTISIIPAFPESSEIESNEIYIPDWVKHNAKWWYEEKITDLDYFNNISYLSKNNILQTPLNSDSSSKDFTYTFVVDDFIQKIPEKESETFDLDKIPLNQFLPDRKNLTGTNSNDWVLEKEGSDPINYQGSSVEGYRKDFSKPKDDSVLEISVHKFNSGGAAWSLSNSRIQEIKTESQEEIEDMKWSSKPNECVGFVEKIERKYNSWIYCVFDDIRVHVYGFGRYSERETQQSTTVITQKITNGFDEENDSLDGEEKQISHILNVTMSSKEILIPLRSSTENLLISGNLTNSNKETPLKIVIAYPDEQENQLTLPLTKNGRFEGIFPITSFLPEGEYRIQFFYDEAKLGETSFGIFRGVPNWIKNEAFLWSNGELPDDSFYKGLSTLNRLGLIELK